MPGPSYNNPQLELETNLKRYNDAQKQKQTEREKAKEKAKVNKEAAGLRDQIYNNRKKIQDAETLVKSTEVTKNQYRTALNLAIRNSFSPSGPGGATQTSGELSAIASAQALYNERVQLITTLNNNIKDLENKNKSITKQLNALFAVKTTTNFNNLSNKDTSNTGGGSGGGGSNNVTPKKSEEQKPKGPYKYNFPLIKPARFSTASSAPLNSSLGDRSVLVDVPAMSGNNAENYWINNSPGRGVLRVNREYMKNILNNTTTEKGDTNKLDTLPGAIQRAQDRQLYGFRFLYNPEKIQMIYDVNTDLHPGLVQTGKDVFLPLTKSSSAISLDLVLNRIEDMKYKSDPRLAIRNQVYFGAGETESILPDILEIHEKGTMYDIEYLFKTMNAPHATFNSTYNGKTADMGFIRPTILELHLGNRLRYPVRVLNLSIEHKIFDPRMVPTFSIVRIAFARFIEFETKKEIGGGGGGGARRLL